MTPITLLTAATSQVCQERGVPFPPEAQAEFSDPHITRVAEVFAELVRAEQEKEARLMRARMTRLQAERDGIALAIALSCNMRIRTGSGAVKYATAIEQAVRQKAGLA